MNARRGTCASCLYVHAQQPGPVGDDEMRLACLRYPPTPVLLDARDMSFAAVHPSVAPDHHCGEYCADPSIIKDH